MPISSILCRGKILPLERPWIMGVLNVTPDSFYDGAKYTQEKWIVEHVAHMVEDGVSIIDIGGQSTRPGSARIQPAEESLRVMPAIKAIRKQFPLLPISIDTYHSQVAEAAVGEGVDIVNDVSSGNMDVNMIPLVAKIGVPYIAMHMSGTPETMQKNPHYDDVVRTVISFLADKIKVCRDAGIHDVIIDPGFGFGKTIHHNFEILASLNALQMLDCPVLVGLSRKSFIQKTLDVDAEGALNGTTAANMVALMNGANILRVHDVKPAVEAVKIFMAQKNAAR